VQCSSEIFSVAVLWALPDTNKDDNEIKEHNRKDKMPKNAEV